MNQKRTLVLVILVVWLASFVVANAEPPQLTAEQAKDHIGEICQLVCGVVASAKYAASTRRSPTFLNLTGRIRSICSPSSFGEPTGRVWCARDYLRGKAGVRDGHDRRVSR